MSDIQKKKVHHLIPGDGYLTIRLVGACEFDSIDGVLEEIKALIGDPFPHVIVNSEHLTSISKDWIRLLLAVQVELKKFNKSMRLILVNAKFKEVLKREGLDSAFKIAPNLREALIQVGLVKKKTLDTDFINPFLTATLHVLSVQAGVKAQQGKIYLKKDSDTFVGDVSGIIGIVSESFSGSVVISFPEKTFLNVMGGILGETFTTISKDIIDGAGEITNMIFGQAKITLNEKGYGIKTAIPSVVSGKDHSMTSLGKGPIVVIPFTSEAGEFFIEICISN